MKLLIALLTISAQLLYVHSNPCRWLDEGCVIKCLQDGGGSSSLISGYVQTIYDEGPDCHSTGVKLILPRDVTSYTVRANWLSTLNINLTDLEIDAEFISNFESNVFTSAVFATVKKLTFTNFRLITSEDVDIKKTIFTGFHALEELMVTNSIVKIWNNGWLDHVNGTIKSLVVTGVGQESPPMQIENLTGGSSSRTLSNVEYVKIQYNLTNKVNHLSFTSIPNVIELDLSDCSITTIKESTFEKIGSKLQLLNLERNNLKTLPAGIFSSLYLSSSAAYFSLDINSDDLQILMSGNSWECTCSLEHFKDLLNVNTNFVGEIVCSTPDEIENYPIKETEFCPLPVTTTTTTTTESATIPVDNSNGNDMECSPLSDAQSKTKITIQPRLQQIRLTRTSDGVSVKLQKYSTDLILIWSAQNFADGYDYSSLSDCFTNLSNPILIGDLAKDTSYTFCLMNISQKTVSPLDCVSYYSRGEEEQLPAVWLYANDKPLTIFLIVIVCIANIFIGLVIGATYLKCNGYESFSFRMTFQCWKVRKGSKRLTVSTADDRAPPLPPHPLRDIKGEEVYYY
ncbi:hypothetical protein HA402_010450 [Bradysia odoriphaga]|nr:hypothetical protein HA402_010450 [Bradysia odoriphaga]